MLGKITDASSYNHTINGPTNAFASGFLATFGAQKALTGIVDIAYTAANIAANIATAQSLVQQGHVGSIRLIDAGTARLQPTGAQITANASVLAAITSPFTLAQTVTAAAAASAILLPGVDTLVVEDTRDELLAHLASLQNLAVTGGIQPSRSSNGRSGRTSPLS